MALSKEETVREYIEKYLKDSQGREWHLKFFGRDPEKFDENYDRPTIRDLEWFHNAIVPSFDPNGRKIYFTTTNKTEDSSNAKLVKRLLEINGGKLVQSFPECNTGVYWGEGYCDYISMNGLLRMVEENDITLLLFYREGHTMFHCEHSFLNPSPDCPELVEVKRLRKLGKKILKFPLGETCYVRNRPSI